MTASGRVSTGAARQRASGRVPAKGRLALDDAVGLKVVRDEIEAFLGDAIESPVLLSSLDVDMYDVDLFDTPVETIQLLQGKGIVVICYFSAGSHEDWRTDWKEHFPDGADEVTAGKMGEWDEHWLDISKLELLRPIMTERIKLAKEKGCDGVEPDNVDAYTNGDDTGISLSYDDQLSYNTMIATVAHEHGLSVALKNDVEQIADLVEHFDFAVNEECHQWKECDLYEGFTERDKAVFGVEYELDKEDFCPRAREKGLSFMKKKWDLDAWREPC